MSEKLRVVEKFAIDSRGNPHWRECRLLEVKKGELFRMFEPTGEQVFDPQTRRCEWIAYCDAFINENGTATIIVDP